MSAGKRLLPAVGSTFLWPLVLGTISAIGLLAALLGDGAWDAFSAMALGVPLAVIVINWKRRRR